MKSISRFGMIAVLILLPLAVSFFSGCSGKSTPTAPPVPPTSTPTLTPVCGTFSVFGNNTVGTGGNQLEGLYVASEYGLAQPALVYSLSLYIELGLGQVRVAIYANNAGLPGALIVQSQPQAEQAGWNMIHITPTYLPPGNYWLAYQFSGSDLAATYYTSGSPSGVYVNAPSFGNFPSSFPLTGVYSYNANWCFYASYCPVALYTNTPTATGTLPTYTPTVTYTPTSTATKTWTPTPSYTPTSTHTPGCANTVIADISSNINGTPVIGNNTGLPSLYSCGVYGPGSDALYTFYLTTPQTITVSNCNSASNWFTNFKIFQGACGCGDVIGSSGPMCGFASYGSQLSVTLGTGRYYLTVEGYTSADHGNYQIWISNLIPTATPTSTYTPTFSLTPTWTGTFTATFTRTSTPTITNTPTGTLPTATFTGTPTSTPTTTPTASIHWVEATSWGGFDNREGFDATVFNNNLWIAGGNGNGGNCLNDVWSSPDGVNWTEAVTNAAWSARQWASLVTFDNGEGAGPQLWLVGGDTCSNNAFADVWSSPDGATWSAATTTAAFGPRDMQGCVVLNGKMYVMGGVNLSTYYDDAWSSPDGVNWTRTTASIGLGGRVMFGCAVFNGKIWIAGGGNNTWPYYYNDVWSSPDGITWTQVLANAPFSVRSGIKMLVYNNQLWVLSGAGSTSDVAIWSSPDGLNWTEETGTPEYGAARDDYAAAVFAPSTGPNTGVTSMWVIDGNGSFYYLSDIWHSP